MILSNYLTNKKHVSRTGNSTVIIQKVRSNRMKKFQYPKDLTDIELQNYILKGSDKK
jgi:hypothetical protein